MPYVELPPLTVKFTMSEPGMSVAKAAGVDSTGMAVTACPFNVGDFVEFPSTPAVTFRINARLYDGAAKAWEVFVVRAPRPGLESVRT